LTTTRPGATRIISIGGGKGGVGKSIVAANLAAVMAKSGKRVILADMDLGAANQHLLLGIDQPKAGIDALLGRDGQSVADALSDTPLANLKLIAGSGASVGAANISHAEKMRIIRKLRALPADVVIIDVGAGVGYNALDFFELGSQRVIVATPQVTSIHDAYSFLKGAILRTLRHHADKASDVALLEPASASGEGAKVHEILAQLKNVAPDFAAKVFDVLKNFGTYMVGNQLTDPSQAGVFHAVSKMMLEYLGVSVPILGWIKSSTRVYDSVNKRTPLMLQTAPSEEEQTFRAIADALLVDDILTEEEEEIILESELELEAATVEDAALGAEAPAVMNLPGLTPPAVPVGAPDAPVSSRITPTVYVRPPRGPARPEKLKKKSDGRNRRVTLPGMTPARARATPGGQRSR
jgi:flagellar biosynthesis protein FlhG